MGSHDSTGASSPRSYSSARRSLALAASRLPLLTLVRRPPPSLPFGPAFDVYLLYHVLYLRGSLAFRFCSTLPTGLRLSLLLFATHVGPFVGQVFHETMMGYLPGQERWVSLLRWITRAEPGASPLQAK